MKIEDLKNDIAEQIRKQKEKSPSPKAIEINIENLPLGKVDLSLILWQKLLSEEIDFDNDGKPLTTVYLIIHSDFDEIQIDNRLKCFAVFEDVKGNILYVGDPKYGSFGDDLNLDLHISGCQIDTVKISTPLKRIGVYDLTQCQSLDVTFLNPTRSIPVVYIRADIKSISFKFAQIESISIFNVGTKQQLYDTELYMLRCEISDFFYQTDLPLKLNCFSSTYAKRFFLLNKENADFIKLSHNILNLLTIQFHAEASGNLLLEDNEIKTLYIGGHSETGLTTMRVLEIKETSLSKDFVGKIKNLSFSEGIEMCQFINRGEMSFDSVNTDRCPLVIKNSILGKTLFFNCTTPDSIIFHNSSIVETQFFNSTTPMLVQAVGESRSVTAFKDQGDAYRQLKIAASKEGNRELANYYRSKELTAHYQSIRFLKEPAEKITLFLNFSNNHGLSWLKTLLLILLFVGPLMYAWFLVSLNYVLDLSDLAIVNGLKIWSHYFEFIIPGYLYPSKSKFTFLSEMLDIENFDVIKLSLYSRIIIYFNDIVVMPYLIIQMITAFRRHVKSD